ncbi:MAG TPA: ATP-binding cassette domain-containing protein [candidate division Zixibacteria bacterium]|nr:ATP-binding cassette domain-containing protein [candidate division Zixibacteria bacterium]
MIECKDLIKIYYDEENEVRVPALRGCDLSVKSGEIFSIIGPSGSGKTTLINILAGLDTCSSGDVIVGEYRLAQMSTKELNNYRLKMIGIVDQFPERTLFLDGTIRDNLRFVSNINKKSAIETQNRNQEILEKLGIDHLDHRIVRGLSGGEMIRTAIACALAKDSPVLLCDEPTGQLDSLNTLRVKDLLKQITKDFGTTVLVVTHDPRFQDGANKTCEIRDGRVSSVIAVSEQLVYGNKKRFPLKFKMQIDSTNNIRLPDFIINILNLTKAAELQVTKKGDIRLVHPEGAPPKEVILEKIKFTRKELVMEDLPAEYFQQANIIIELNNISKTYCSNGNVVHALSEINVRLKKGELVFILGPSGSGKTTLIKLLTGLERATSGKIKILDQIFSDLSDAQKSVFRKQNIGQVSQQGNLHPLLTIAESFYLKDFFSGKIIKNLEEKNVNKYLEQFNIAHRKHSFPLEISGGELQRASLAIATGDFPQIIILDEPTANLDSELAEEAMQEIYNLHSNTETTFLIATHDINLIKDGSRAIVLEDGKIKCEGIVTTPKDS